MLYLCSRPHTACSLLPAGHLVDAKKRGLQHGSSPLIAGASYSLQSCMQGCTAMLPKTSMLGVHCEGGCRLCRYMPAELLLEGKMTKAADVYGFSMLAWELFSGDQLFRGLRQSQVGIEFLKPLTHCT